MQAHVPAQAEREDARRPDRPVRPGPDAALLGLQRAAGNRAVAARIQRHALEDALPDAPALVGELTADVQRGGGGPEAQGPALAEASPAPEEAGPAPADRTPEEAKTQKEAATASGAAFVKSGDRALGLAAAEKVLTGAFGGLKKIVPGAVVVLADDEAIWKKYDEINVGKTDPVRKVAWKVGDAKIVYPSGLRGFATGPTVYVNSSAAIATTVPHEILHNNTAADFRKTVGETFNEGKTNNLALEACLAAGIPKPANMSYVTEMGLTDKLEAIIGKDVLTNAYFSGASGLEAAYGAQKGPGRWDGLRTASNAKDYAKVGAELDKVATIGLPGASDLSTGLGEGEAYA